MPERIVRPGILSSDAVNQLSWAEEVFYRRLMSVIDDYGRFDGRDAVIRAAIYPLKTDHVSNLDVGKWKAKCAEAGLVRIYFVGGKEFVEVLKFDQRMRGKPKWPDPVDSDPPPSAASRGESRRPAASRGGIPPSSGTIAETGTKTETVAPRGDLPPGFAEFWKLFPAIGRERSSRKECLAVWNRDKLEAKHAEIIAGLNAWLVCGTWTREGGKFVKGAHRWLANAKWAEPPADVQTDDDDRPVARVPTPEEIAWATGRNGDDL